MTASGRRRLRQVASAILFAVATTHALAQVPAVPGFDAVSVCPNSSGADLSASQVLPGARHVATNVTLRMLIKTAYGVHDEQIVDGPPWTDTDRFDLTAKGAPKVIRPRASRRFRRNVQRLLNELVAEGLLRVGHTQRPRVTASFLPTRWRNVSAVVSGDSVHFEAER